MSRPVYRRPLFDVLLNRLRTPRKFIQALVGPRQVGKTTLVRQVLEALGVPHHYAAADSPAPRDPSWLESQWEIARLRSKGSGAGGCVLVLDEAQKIAGWSEVIKRLWDEDAASGRAVKVVLLGSTPLTLRTGLTESLAGRFELIRAPHWSFAEIRAAFGWELDRYLYFGGYPGSAELVEDEERWRRYILDSLVETTIARDILLQTRVDKPALLRQLFKLGCDYSGQVLSYQKMLGQLQDAGNTVTLAHYLELLSGAGMLTGLQKFSGSRVRQRGSSPKLVALNTALMTSGSEGTFALTRADGDAWGRLVETAIGAHLINGLAGSNVEVYYWREANHEVDFVLKTKGMIVALEVTSSRKKDSLPGLAAFGKEFQPRRKLLVGGQGIPLEEFLTTPPEAWVS
ncbi:MAG: ATP-binding protein [Elusimicrobia bacterium]|nr:ATP-binding protein [Elusimicrobiota bacterium]